MTADVCNLTLQGDTLRSASHGLVIKQFGYGDVLSLSLSLSLPPSLPLCLHSWCHPCLCNHRATPGWYGICRMARCLHRLCITSKSNGCINIGLGRSDTDWGSHHASTPIYAYMWEQINTPLLRCQPDRLTIKSANNTLCLRMPGGYSSDQPRVMVGLSGWSAFSGVLTCFWLHTASSREFDTRTSVVRVSDWVSRELPGTGRVACIG